jgi:hypothetical protein
MGFMQQDASEFFSRLLNVLVHESNSGKEGSSSQDRRTFRCSGNDEDNQVLSEMWEKELRINDSPLFQMFTGVRKTILKCKHCPEVTTLFVPIESITLALSEDRILRDVMLVQWNPGEAAVRGKIVVSKRSRELYEQAVLNTFKLENVSAVLFVDAQTMKAVDPATFDGPLLAFAVPFRDCQYFLVRPNVAIHPFLCQVPLPDISKVSEIVQITLGTAGLVLAEEIPMIEKEDNPDYPFLFRDVLHVKVTSTGNPIDYGRFSAVRTLEITDDIHKYLNAFKAPVFKADRICDSCKQEGAVETNIVVKLPPVVVLHIQKTKTVKELKTAVPPVDYPETLNFNSISAGPTKNYRLFAVVDHLGQSVDRGHYIAHVYHHVRKEWFTFNDENCTKCLSFRTNNAYLLFYEQIEGE